MTRASSLATVRVQSLTRVARDVLLLRLAPVDPPTPMPATAGAHIDVHLQEGMTRQYSLLVGVEGDDYLIAVKKMPQGRGGSVALHERAHVGQTLQIGAPRNLFTLVEDGAPTVLFAGGIGITPIWSMARRLEALQQRYVLHYACRTREEALFLPQMHERPHVNLHFDDEAGGVFDMAAACAAAPQGSHLYCCGPAPMLAAFRAATQSRPADRVHWEDFAGPQAAPGHGGFDLRLARSQRTLRVNAGERIVDVLRGAGLPVSVSCEQGICGACETTVLSGRPEHGCQVLSPAEREAGATMMICCGGCRDETLVLDL